MASLSKVTLIGNLGSDPEMRYTPDGKAVTSFRMATNRRYTTSAGENKEEQTGLELLFGASELRVAINF